MCKDRACLAWVSGVMEEEGSYVSTRGRLVLLLLPPPILLPDVIVGGARVSEIPHWRSVPMPGVRPVMPVRRKD